MELPDTRPNFPKQSGAMIVIKHDLGNVLGQPTLWVPSAGILN